LFLFRETLPLKPFGSGRRARGKRAMGSTQETGARAPLFEITCGLLC
jgi:hypothetical protein